MTSCTAQVKNLALMAYISVGCSKKPVIEFLDEFGVERLESINPRIVPNATKVSRTAAVERRPQHSKHVFNTRPGSTCERVALCPQVFMNGEWIGVHRDPTMLVQALRDMRRMVDINTEVLHSTSCHKLTPRVLSRLMAYRPPAAKTGGCGLHVG
jgi:DNA-directed RNA polymerase II subunit RPB2